MNLRAAEFIQNRWPVGGRAVVKNVPRVRSAVFAPYLGSQREQAPVSFLDDIFLRQGSGEAGPPGPRIVFVERTEKRLSTRHVKVSSFVSKSGISPEMAIRLSKAFGSSPETWLKMQLDYDLAQVRQREDTIQVKRVQRPQDQSHL